MRSTLAKSRLMVRFSLQEVSRAVERAYILVLGHLQHFLRIAISIMHAYTHARTHTHIHTYTDKYINKHIENFFKCLTYNACAQPNDFIRSQTSRVQFSA